jgi:hypothetical protein
VWQVTQGAKASEAIVADANIFRGKDHHLAFELGVMLLNILQP